MSINSYAFFEELYAGIKPIRGRAVQVRPIGKRIRDWEQIDRRLQADGTYSYVARLYSTDVVEYFANGDIVLRAGDWQTPTTAEFIHEHSPFPCYKRYGKLWVMMGTRWSTDPDPAYPLGAEFRVKQVGEHKYEPHEPVVIKKRVVDRDKAKQARAAIKPFMDWAKTFLKLSDGWVMHETCKVAFGFNGINYGLKRRINMGDIYEMLTRQGDVEPDAIYLRALCHLSEDVPRYDRRIVESIKYESAGFPMTGNFYDTRIDFEDVRTKMHNYVRNMDASSRIVEVMPTHSAIHGVV